MPLTQYLLERQKQKLGISSPKVKELPKPIPKRSAKMKVTIREVKKFYALFLSRPENKFCNIQIDENCTKIATTVNHKKRRGKNNIMNEDDCESSCSYCNIKIEEKDQWARDNGHLKSKFN